MSARLDQLHPEEFESLVGEAVTVQRPAGGVVCQVKEVRRLPVHSFRRTPPFAVVLRGPATASFAQGVYALEHPTRGTIELFMVPIGPDGAGPCYEITFN